jgi:hypothetical protein
MHPPGNDAPPPVTSSSWSSLNSVLAWDFFGPGLASFLFALLLIVCWGC